MTQQDGRTLYQRSPCLHIGHVEFYMTEAWLRREFSEFGIVEKVHIKPRRGGIVHIGMHSSGAHTLPKKDETKDAVVEDVEQEYEKKNGVVEVAEDAPNGEEKNSEENDNNLEDVEASEEELVGPSRDPSQRYFAFVTFRHVKAAENAMQTLAREEFWNGNLHFKRPKPRHKKLKLVKTKRKRRKKKILKNHSRRNFPVCQENFSVS